MPALRLVVTFLLAALLLTGCIDSDVGIHYRSQTQGEIVQHIRLGDRLDPNNPTTQRWLKTLEERSRPLGGRFQHPSSQEFLLTIPFNNGKDLENKFNTFFSAAVTDEETAELPDDLPNFTAHLQVTERNRLVAQRNRLVLDLDLQDLGVRSPTGTLLVSPNTLLSLEFRLDTPWGADTTGSDPSPEVEGSQQVWQLQPGTVNHLEAVFWVPSLLGVGTVAIALFVSVGAALRGLLFGGMRDEGWSPQRVR